MSKTIPIWACVLNCAIKNYLQRMPGESHPDGEMESNTSLNESDNVRLRSANWDCTLHLPIWVPNSEKAIIETRLQEWTTLLESCGADISSLASNLTKPFRPLWISQKTLIWLNEVPDHDSWDFIPLILISASASEGLPQLRTSSGFSWHYIPGAGDDEESWARELSPGLFWKHAFELIDAGPELCNRKVAEIVERERVYLSQREYNIINQLTKSGSPMKSMNSTSYCNEHSIFWLGSTNLAVSSTAQVSDASDYVDCVLNCDSNSSSLCFPSTCSYLHLPMVTSKLDRFSVIRNLPSAVDFAKLNLSRGRRLLVCCHNGEDISICVCLAILISLFDDRGSFDGGKSFMSTNMTKWEMRKKLVFVCKFATNARPSRGNLKQVFGFLSREQETALTRESALESA